jgi:hypothetical protein
VYALMQAAAEAEKLRQGSARVIRQANEKMQAVMRWGFRLRCPSERCIQQWHRLWLTASTSVRAALQQPTRANLPSAHLLPSAPPYLLNAKFCRERDEARAALAHAPLDSSPPEPPGLTRAPHERTASSSENDPTIQGQAGNKQLNGAAAAAAAAKALSPPRLTAKQ